MNALDIDAASGDSDDHVVGHTSDGDPIPPQTRGRPSTVSPLSSLIGLSDGLLEWRDPEAGIEGDFYYEPVGMVNDDRLEQLYQSEYERCMNTDSEKIAELVERLETYVQARGLDVQAIQERAETNSV
jgi:hypothetical protein